MSSNVSLKLLIHKTRRKILFGEADKNFIDFLFTILALPVASIFNLVSTESMVGPLRNLYHSVQNLNTNYFQEKYQKNINLLLKPKVQIPRSHISLISLLPIESSLPEGYYKCSNPSCYGDYFGFQSGLRCTRCNKAMQYSLNLVLSSPDDELMVREESSSGKRGYVKEMNSYMVMEDLTVKPMSAMSSISMLAEFGVDDASLIEEKVVYLNREEGLNLLRASLSSSTVLSDVFLHKIDFGDSSTIPKEVEREDQEKEEEEEKFGVSAFSVGH